MDRILYNSQTAHTQLLRDESCASARIRIAIESKTVTSWGSRKKEGIFCTEGDFFKICVLSQYIVY